MFRKILPRLNLCRNFKITLPVFFMVAILSPLSSQEKALKKLYISSITAEGVPEIMAKKARERLEFALYEHFGKEYRVLTNEDVKVMFKKAAEIMATGCSAESCQMEMADAVDADEIIYGTLSREGTKLKLTARTLLRNRKSLAITKKSMVVVSFFETELEHYISEAAVKLMNPSYGINKPVIRSLDEKISLPAIRIDQVKESEIAVLKLSSDDATIQNMLNYLKEIVQEGDKAFTSQQYDIAINKFSKVLKLIKTKITAEKKVKMANFTDDIARRLDAAYVMKYKADIESIDKEILKNKMAGEREPLEMRGRYRAIESKVNEISFDGAGMSSIRKTLSLRCDAMTEAVAVYYEKQGDNLYSTYKFNEALKAYSTAIAYLDEITVRDYRQKLFERFNHKKQTTSETGKSYLHSRMRALLDRAELFNLQEKNVDVRKAMRMARDLLMGDLSPFITYDVVKIYNNVAGLLEFEKITIETEPNLFAVISRFRDNGNGTITDEEKELLWQKCSAGQNASNCSGKAQEMNWYAGGDYCKKLKLAGKKWRLPNKDEIQDLVQHYDVFFPNTMFRYWASSSNTNGTRSSWIVDFYGGTAPYDKAETNYVRCVANSH